MQGRDLRYPVCSFTFPWYWTWEKKILFLVQSNSTFKQIQFNVWTQFLFFFVFLSLYLPLVFPFLTRAKFSHSNIWHINKLTALIWTANIMIYRPSLYRPEKWKKRNHYYQESQVIVEVLPKFQAQIFNSVACSRLLKEFPICTRWCNQNNNQGRLWMEFLMLTSVMNC